MISQSHGLDSRELPDLEYRLRDHEFMYANRLSLVVLARLSGSAHVPPEWVRGGFIDEPRIGRMPLRRAGSRATRGTGGPVGLMAHVRPEITRRGCSALR